MLLKNQKEKREVSYLSKYSTSKNREKFRLMTKARFMLINGELSQESFDIFMEHMKT